MHFYLQSMVLPFIIWCYKEYYLFLQFLSTYRHKVCHFLKNKHFLTISEAEPQSVCSWALQVYSSVDCPFMRLIQFCSGFVAVVVIFLYICKGSYYSKVVDLSCVWWIFSSIVHLLQSLFVVYLAIKWFSKYLCS